MAPGAIYSHFSGDKDEVELIDAVFEQRHEIEQTSQDLFDEELCGESLIQTPRPKKNARGCNSEDIETTPCNKKSKIGENHIVNYEDLVNKEVDNVNKTSNNINETIYENLSSVSKTEGSSQTMQTVAADSSPTPDTPRVGAALNTSQCKIFGLIKTEGDNKGICIITLNQLTLCSLEFKEEFDEIVKNHRVQKVMIHRVPGNGTVAGVRVRRLHSFIDVGVGDTCYLY